MMKPAQNVLLIGAGFTENFGGYLGTEMWSVIFSQREIGQYPMLRKHLLNTMDYETAYHEVLDSNRFSQDERNAFTRAIQNAYQEMHGSVCTMEHGQNEMARLFCRLLISRFAGAGENRGFLFTLNQDLCIEKFYRNAEVHPSNRCLSIPGIKHPNSFFSGRLSGTLRVEDLTRLPNESEVQELESTFWERNPECQFVYLKLHGSYGWKSADGSDAMVIGGQKPGRIDREPYLKWALKMFKQVLRGPNCNLVVIGYGFRDAHINEVIADAIREHQLRLYVISPLQPEEFRKVLLQLPAELFSTNEKTIWEGLCGYFFGTVFDLYSGGKVDLTPKGESLFRSLAIL